MRDLPGSESAQASSWRTPAEAVALVLHGHTVRAATPITLIVGTILSFVNEGTEIASGTPHPSTWIRVAVNFVVPFCVASIGWLSARRNPDHGRH